MTIKVNPAFVSFGKEMIKAKKENNRMEMYNHLEDILHDMENNKLLEYKIIDIIYKEGVELSNHFGEKTDAEIERKIGVIENVYNKFLEVHG